MKHRKKRKNTAGKKVTVFVVLLLILAGTLLLRYFRADSTAGEPVVETESAVIPETQPPQTEEPVMDEGPVSIVEEPAATEEPLSRLSFVQASYNNRTYQLVSDMVYTYQHLQSEGNEAIRALVEELKNEDPTLGEIWDGIMSYWDYANTAMPIEPGALPEGLPQDDSLCFVVLGYQLMDDGTMAPELIGRCELALACAEKYPNACLAATGGGTALKEETATEAGVMADWLIAHGVAAERIIREEASKTTHQNARNTCAILTESYPRVHDLVIITSDYHMPLGCLMFTEMSLLYLYGNDRVPFEVTANVAYGADGDWNLWGPFDQARYVWNLAAPDL